MDISIRDLKAHLSEYLQRVEAGATIVVKNRQRTVARIIPEHAAPLIDCMRSIPGISWAGGKPRGMKAPKPVSGGRQVSDIVLEDRR